jgi:hypothetical protein
VTSRIRFCSSGVSEAISDAWALVVIAVHAVHGGEVAQVAA